MGSRQRRRLTRQDERPPSSERAFELAASAIGLVASVVALFEARWWIGVLGLAATFFGTYRVSRGMRISVRVFGESVVAGIFCTLAVAGAVANWPFGGYAGEFIVVGAFLQPAQVAPFEGSVDVPNVMFEHGETVTVVCRQRGWKRPSTWWYRLRGSNGFLSADSLDPSPATSPGTPPEC